MIDHVASVEARIREHRLFDPQVTWADEFIFPYYHGLSIYNLMQSVIGVFGADATDPLDGAVWQALASDPIDRIVVVITDGLGYRLLKTLLDDDAELRADVTALSDDRPILPLTTVLPSTTATVLPTLWSAATPTQTGMYGTTFYLRRFGMMGDMLRFRPTQGTHTPETFADWGMAPESFVPLPSLGETLLENNVPTHLILERNLMGTGLSRIMHRSVTRTYTHAGLHDIWTQLRNALSDTTGQRAYVNMYLPHVDSLSHRYGATSSEVHTEVRWQMANLRRILSDTRYHDGRTLLLITADHGHQDANHHLDLMREPKAQPVYRAMRHPYGGDSRFAHLHLHAASLDKVRDVLQRDFADQLIVLSAEEAVAAGLYGQHTPHPETAMRLGDLILLLRPGIRLLDDFNRPQAISLHGGMSEYEMLVPLIAKRL